MPEPVAFFPLNVTYGTREIQDRVPQGDSSGVQLAAGPDGRVNGSYEFFGYANSSIQFNNSDGGVLDVRYSITMLCWVYYDGRKGPFFSYSPWPSSSPHPLYFGALNENLYVLFKTRNDAYFSVLNTGALAGGWNFVGASYNRASGEAKLWIDGVAVQTIYAAAEKDLETKYNVVMGASLFYGVFFKGRITQMRLYNISLSQEQVREIMGKSLLQILELEIIRNT